MTTMQELTDRNISRSNARRELSMTTMQELTDKLGRPVRDLRISVTDRCNLRCTYCMPREVFNSSYKFLERSMILSFEDIVRSVRLFVALGVRKVRLTGGEPLLRKEIERLIAAIARVEGIEDIGLTTNGVLLDAARARQLKSAGLSRITVSLDALDQAVFSAISDSSVPVSRVLDAIDCAGAVQLPVKVNMVVKRGVNDSEILPMARYFYGSGHVLRFIEYMDVGTVNGWRLDDVFPAAEVVRSIDAEMPLEPLRENYRGEVAKRWRYRRGGGEIGVIASVTDPFCGDCTRIRLSAEGRLYTCLFASRGYDLRRALLSGDSDESVLEWVAGVWRQRSDQYSVMRSRNTVPLHKVEMSYIGG